MNLTTTFTPDAFGNVITVADPLGNATTTQYDNMRRKIAEENRNGGATALPLKETTYAYDLNGRLTTENRATGFDGSGNPTGFQIWPTQYTPTGKVYAKLDPIVTGIAQFGTYFDYDALDRERKTLDGSGRETNKTWDLAGQQLTEVWAKGYPLQQTYQTFAWWPDGEKESVTDARSNVVNLAYDGFNRVSAITFPDTTSEQSQYDPDGDMTIWTNRGGFGIVRCYDVLNRKISETGTTGASSGNQTLACPTGGTANRGTRVWDFYPRTFTYDLAGRLTAANTTFLNLGYTYDAAGRPTARTGTSWTMAYAWDAASNLTGETYPDGSVFCFAYDALDRMTGAATTGACPGSATLATLGYDPLGRRSGVTFGDSSTETYGYDSADRMTSLAHVFPNRTTDNVALTYGYDEADRELSKAFSNPAYAWGATTGTTSYTTASSLNQYQPSGTYTWLWWPEGPQKEDPAVQENYDEQGQLTLAYITTTPGTIDPNNWWQAKSDARGHRFVRSRQAVSGTAYPTIYEETDGLRPETILDAQYSTLAGVLTFQGFRRYVLGPDPDEYLAFRDFDAGQSLYYPHIDKEGTTIALSSGGQAVNKFTYDVYGQSSGAIADVGPGATTYPFRYTGQRLDPTTAFTNYKARDYSAALGRFLQPDPAGIDQGPNLYEYVGDDPVDVGDPSGECGSGVGHNPCGPDFSGIEGTRADAGRLGDESGGGVTAAPAAAMQVAQTQTTQSAIQTTAALPSISRGANGILTDTQVAGIIFHETRSLHSSPAQLSSGRDAIANVILNGDEAHGARRPGTASPTAASDVPSAETGTYNASVAAVAQARAERARGYDPTAGSEHFNLRPNNSTRPWRGLPNSGNYGPFENSYPTGGRNGLPASGVYIDTYSQ